MSRDTLLPLLLLTALLAGGVAVALDGGTGDARWTPSRVVRVVDGDTVVLAGIGTARIIGVDTPEVHGRVECFGPAASAFTRRHLRGRAVLVRTGREPQDRYGRALVHLRRPGDPLFSAALLRGGYARRLAIAPNTAYAERLDALEAQARERGDGLWGRCPDPGLG